MRTKKYKKIVEDNGYKYYENNYSITARKYSEEHYDIEIKVGKLRPGRLEVNIKGFCGDESDIILKAMELAETPLEDRREEKKFYLKHRWFKPKSVYKNYLNYWIGTNEYWLDYKNETEEIQTQFTRKEIEEIKKKFNTDLADFKEVEVEDEN